MNAPLQPPSMNDPNARRAPVSSSLPAELILHIFSFLENEICATRSEFVSALLLCCLVSRSWSECARARLYACVELRTPHSAQVFMDALSAGGVGALVHSIRFWTAIYAQRSVPGRQLPFHRTWKRAEALPGDRFFDIVLRRCPNLTSIAIHNRVAPPNGDVRIVRACPVDFSLAILSHLTLLDLDASRYSRVALTGHWLINALSSGHIHLPNLEELRVRCRAGYSMPQTHVWGSLPRLRRLYLTDLSLTLTMNHISVHTLLVAAAPSLEELRLCRVTPPTAEQGSKLTLMTMTSLKQIVILDSPFPPTELAVLLLSVSDTLEELRLSTTYSSTTSEISGIEWPRFKRLRRMHLAWQDIQAEWSITLLSSVLPRLHELEITLSSSLAGLDDSALSMSAMAVVDKLNIGMALERITLEGNKFLDAERLSHVIDAMPCTTTLRIGTSLSGLPLFLTNVSPSLRTLELRLVGIVPDIEDFLLQVVPTALPNLTFLKRICFLEDRLERPTAEIKSRFLSICASLGGPEVCFYVENDNGPWAWTTPTYWYAPTEIRNTLPAEAEAHWTVFLGFMWKSIQRTWWPIRYVLATLWILLLLPVLLVYAAAWIVTVFREDPQRSMCYCLAGAICGGIIVGASFLASFENSKR